jgi:NADH-quinone oxidoreductase subunit J
VLPQQIVFGVLAATIALSALRVVTSKNIVHCALYLVMVLGGIAGLYVLLAAEFIFAVQLIVYIGAIVVLFLFGIMLTRAPLGATSDLDNDQRWLAGIVALFLFGALGAVLKDAFGSEKIHINDAQRTGAVGLDIFSTYVIPFEVISVVLLAALVGAVVIARRD